MSLVLLPEREWAIKACGPDHVIIGMHANFGAVFWLKLTIAEITVRAEDGLFHDMMQAYPEKAEDLAAKGLPVRVIGVLP
jgi:hypothetical protein